MAPTTVDGDSDSSTATPIAGKKRPAESESESEELESESEASDQNQAREEEDQEEEEEEQEEGQTEDQEEEKQEEQRVSEAYDHNRAATAKSNETAAKIDAFLRSRCVSARPHIPVPRPPPRPRQPKKFNSPYGIPPCPPSQLLKNVKRCHGPCGMPKTKDYYSTSQWLKPLHRERFCLVCTRLMPPVPPARKKKKIFETSSFSFGHVKINDDDDIIVPKLPSINSNNTTTPKSKKNPDDDFLPAELKRGKQGDTPFGRICSCMCQRPRVCRDLLWRWARLKEAKYINYLTLPNSHKADTPVGLHVKAYREAVLRHLYNNPGGEMIERTISNGSKEVTTTKLVKMERISMVHFHPEVIPYLVQEKESRGNKLNKWRIPIDLGKKTGLKEEDKCLTPDSNDVPSFFVLPNYSLEDAIADVERAETEYKEKFKQFAADNERITTEMAADPSKYVLEIHDLKQQNANLIKENKELKDKMKREKSQQNAMEKKNKQLQNDLEKMARRLSTKKVGRTPRRSAKDIYGDTTGQDLGEEGFLGGDPTGTPKHPKGSGGKRWSDPRMDRAVQARLEDPSLSTEEALRVGGFEFPSLDQKGVAQKDIMDGDNVSVAQRKNNLLRRLRQSKKSNGRHSGGGAEVVQETDETEMSKESDDLEMATVDEFV